MCTALHAFYAMLTQKQKYFRSKRYHSLGRLTLIHRGTKSPRLKVWAFENVLYFWPALCLLAPLLWWLSEVEKQWFVEGLSEKHFFWTEQHISIWYWGFYLFKKKWSENWNARSTWTEQNEMFNLHIAEF